MQVILEVYSYYTNCSPSVTAYSLLPPLYLVHHWEQTIIGPWLTADDIEMLAVTLMLVGFALVWVFKRFVFICFYYTSTLVNYFFAIRYHKMRKFVSYALNNSTEDMDLWSKAKYSEGFFFFFFKQKSTGSSSFSSSGWRPHPGLQASEHNTGFHSFV